MQYLPVYLYNNKLEVILDLNPTSKGVHTLMYQHDLKIQKGVLNQVRIQFKNSDQKRIQIYNTQTFVFSMFDAVNNRLLLEKPLEVLDNTTSTKGLALLTLTENDTLNLDRSSYNYSIKIRNTDGSYSPTYSNTYYDVSGTLHLKNDVNPALKNSIEVTTFNKTFNDQTQKYEHKSGNVYANPEYNGNDGLHTLALYMTAYRGTVFIEATLENSPGVNADYIILEQKTYSGFSGIELINLNGIYSYLRIRHVPAQAPAELDNDNPSYYGSLDKVLYRS